MSRNVPEHDPRSRLEDEGIPDLQDGTPGQQWAVDPQEQAVPGERPIAVDDFGTTADEQRQGEPLAGRLAREVPEEQPSFGVDEPASRPMTEQAETQVETGDAPLSEDGGLGVGSDLDTGFEPPDQVADDAPAQPEEPSGQVWDAPRPAGRLVAPDEGAHEDEEPDAVAAEVGPDAGGYSAEEAAMRIERE
ncbi:DUF5709 domain-containing protein [Actinomadura fulvescens]